MLRRVVLVLVLLVVAWLVACGVLFVWPPAQTGAPAHADAIAVLAGDPLRLSRAEVLVRRHVAPMLAISRNPDESARLAAGGLCRLGRFAGARVICFVARPYSTRGEARTVARLARAHGWGSVVVVSSTYHLTRASVLFHRCWNGRLFFVGARSDRWLLPLDWALESGKLLVQETLERSC